jgi:GT2 family glycosyltransferase
VISVIVPVFRNSVLLEYCLDKLTQQAPSGTEIIVVDDASGPETRTVLSQFPRVRLVEHAWNRGNTVAYNTGAKAASGSILIFMDSDILVQSETVESLRDTLCSVPSIGAVGTLLLFPQNSTIQHVGVAFDSWVLSHVYKGRSLSDLKLKDIEERQAVTAALFACKKATYLCVGGFDQTYRDGLEDIDFCLKCRAHGLTNVVATEARAYHLESATRGPYKQIRRTYNYSIFFTRWAGKFKVDIGEYIERGLSESGCHTLQAVVVVNFCNTPNWPDIAQPLADKGAELLDTYDMSGFVDEGQPIDLYRVLPLAFHKRPDALLFLVDHFSQLANNNHWFQGRPQTDLVIDRHANVIAIGGKPCP